MGAIRVRVVVGSILLGIIGGSGIFGLGCHRLVALCFHLRLCSSSGFS